MKKGVQYNLDDLIKYTGDTDFYIIKAIVPLYYYNNAFIKYEDVKHCYDVTNYIYIEPKNYTEDIIDMNSGIKIFSYQKIIDFIGIYANILIYKIIIPEDALICKNDGHKFFVNKINIPKNNQLTNAQFINQKELYLFEVFKKFKSYSSSQVNFNKLSPESLEEIVRLQPQNIFKIQNSKITYNMFLIAASNIHSFLKHIIPEEYLTHEFLLAAVSYDGKNLQYIKVENRTPLIINAALKQHGMAISYLSKIEVNRLNEKDLIDALQSNISALHYIPNNLRTKTMITIIGRIVSKKYSYDPEVKIKEKFSYANNYKHNFTNNP